MLDNLRVRRKLALLCALFVLPVAFLAWLLVVQSIKDISFAQKEQDGSAYLGELAGLLVQLELAYHGGHPRSDLTPAVTAVRAAERSFGSAMGTAELFGTMVKSLEALGPDGSFDPAMAAVREMIARVGDGSNLILDPDLDSYYAMDLAVVKLPEFVTAASRSLKAAAQPLAKGGRPELKEMAEFLTRLGSYEAILDGVKTSLDAAYRGNPDGSMRPALDPAFRRFQAAALTYGTALRSVTAQEGDKVRPDPTLLTRREAEAVAAAGEFSVATRQELDRLLATRISGFRRALWLSLGASLAVEVLAIVLATWVGRSLSRPLSGLCEVMAVLAGGTRTMAIPYTGRLDEVGAMAQAVEVFRDALVDADRMAERERLQQVERERRAEQLHALAVGFDGSVVGILSTLGGAAGRMGQTSTGMTATAQDTSRRAGTVASAVERTSGNVQAVASAADELSSSISEIGRQVADAARVANSAVGEARAANDIIQGLSTAASRIGEVVTLISDIAGQTNLLALNATIEAARAGEAGKGFAVVASEVKNLASQTARATDDIAEQVQSVQGITTSAVQAIGGILSTIDRVNEISSAIAAAVEEQGAATEEIARNAEQAANGTSEMAEGVGDVHRAADRTGSAAGDVAQAASDLTRETDSLRDCVRLFLEGVRSV